MMHQSKKLIFLCAVAAFALSAQLASSDPIQSEDKPTLKYQIDYPTLVQTMVVSPNTRSCAVKEVHDQVMTFLEEYKNHCITHKVEPGFRSFSEFLTMHEDELGLYLQGCNDFWRSQAGKLLNEELEEDEIAGVATWMDYILEFKKSHGGNNGLFAMNPEIQIELISDGLFKSPDISAFTGSADKMSAMALIEGGAGELCRSMRLGDGIVSSPTRNLSMQEMADILRLVLHPQGIFSVSSYLQTESQNPSNKYVGMYNFIELCDFLDEDWDNYFETRVEIVSPDSNRSSEDLKYIEGVAAVNAKERLYDALLEKTVAKLAEAQKH